MLFRKNDQMSLTSTRDLFSHRLIMPTSALSHCLLSLAECKHGIAPIWCQCSKLLWKLSFMFAWFLKVSMSKSWQSILNSSDKEWKGDKKRHLCFIFWNFFHRAIASPISNVEDWIWCTFRNRWSNVSDGVVEQT